MVPGRVERRKEDLQLEGGISACVRASSLSQHCMRYAGRPPGTFFFFAGEWLNPRAFMCLGKHSTTEPHSQLFTRG